MSDFFSALYSGIERPNVVMNAGPLPPTNPSGVPTTPDGRINTVSSLTGSGVQPYAYGEPDRLSTQAAYLNVPHAVQRIIPQINIPEAQPMSAGGRFFLLNHQVDDGDIAFIIRALYSPYEIIADKKRFNRQGVLYAVDPVCNLATVNYLLSGLQRYGFDRKNEKNWYTLWTAFGIDDYFKKLDGTDKLLSARMQDMQNMIDTFEMDPTQPRAPTLRLRAIMALSHHRRRVAEYIIKNIITPFGVPRGSEKQGGQHEGLGAKRITYPVDFVTALVVDGKARFPPPDYHNTAVLTFSGTKYVPWYISRGLRD